MLWLALHFPLLPLETLSRGMPKTHPLAIEQQQRVLMINSIAEQSGIKPGIRINSALALDANLRCLPRQPAKEQQNLLNLANWSLQFTSIISLQPPDGLLLEIGGSLSLFKGLTALVKKVELGVLKLGYSLHLSVAPTPLGAWLPAHIGVRFLITETSQLKTALGTLPLLCLPINPKTIERLQGMGMKKLHELFKLPRDGLGKRTSQTLVLTLDRALGLQPDPLAHYQPPLIFHSHVDLFQESTGGKALTFACERLLQELSGFLQGHDTATTQLSYRFNHLQCDPTKLNLAFLSPTRDPKHMMSLLKIRLEQTQMPAPVNAIALDCSHLIDFSHRDTDLFEQHHSTQNNSPTLLQLVERLRNRLGDKAVKNLQSHDDHRPEQSWRSDPLAAISNTPNHKGTPKRPLWLLRSPRPIKLQRRSMSLKAGPERIESGWWDGQEINRDYFIFETQKGTRLWVYREIKQPDRWFVHGLFS